MTTPWILFLAVVLVCVAPMTAEKGQETSPPKYDPHTETKMKGTVDEVKLPPKGSEKEPVHLLMKNGTDTLEVYLCPESFLADMGVSFSKGDAIALTGSTVKQDGADLILAREVVKGNDTLVLRDDKGSPVWNWKRR
jgi:hypothetical protein